MTSRAFIMGLLAFWLAAGLCPARAEAAPPRIKVMVLDGSSGPYHRWRVMTEVLVKELKETGLFDVSVVTAPGPGGDFSGFSPKWGDYRVVVMNYCLSAVPHCGPPGRWPDALRDSFAKYVRDGGGVVIFHGADNAFADWDAYNEMIGVGGFGGQDRGAPHWYYKNGKLSSDKRAGPAGTHGARAPFQVVVRNINHPITKGLPLRWMHQGDELYADLRGPGRNMTILATAYSNPANQGSGLDEPCLMVLRYGRGRVFHTTFGHDVLAQSSVDGIVTFQRGVEWAATGRVTQKLPRPFPTNDTVVFRSDIAAMDPNAPKGLDPLDRDMPAGRDRPGGAPSNPTTAPTVNR